MADHLVYLPPHNSAAYNHLHTPPLAAISADLHAIATLPTPSDIVVAGDINGRTGTTPDGAEAFDHTALEALIPQLPPDLQRTPPTPIPPRSNADTVTNKQGRGFLDLTCEHGLAITNGRTPSDPTGAFTFPLNTSGKGSSTVDYFAVSLNLWPAVVDMVVCPKAPGSDHCPVLLTLRRTAPTEPAPAAAAPTIPRFRYSPTEANIAAYRAALGADPLLSPAHLANLPAAEAATLLQERILHHAASTHPSQRTRDSATQTPTAISPGLMKNAKPPAGVCATPSPTPPPTWRANCSSSSGPSANLKSLPTSTPGCPTCSTTPATTQLPSGAASSPATRSTKSPPPPPGTGTAATCLQRPRHAHHHGHRHPHYPMPPRPTRPLAPSPTPLLPTSLPP